MIVIALTIGWAGQLTGAQAATNQEIIFIGPVGQTRVGETLAVDIQLDSGGQRINAADLTVRYDPAAIEVVRLARERSMFTLWPEEPSWDDQAGTMHITGGRPGGLYAVRGLVATIYLTPLRGGTTTLQLDPVSASYLNDNAGTPAAIGNVPLELNLASDLLTALTITSPTHPTPTSWSRSGRIVIQWTPEPTKEYSYRLSSDSQAIPDETLDAASGEIIFNDMADGIYYFTIKERLIQGPWQPLVQRRFLIDGTPPAAFTIEKLAPADVSGQEVISWGALDTTSGVARSIVSVDGRVLGAVTSPLTLDPAWQDKQIEVTVVDAAGNARSNVWPADRRQAIAAQPWLTGLIVVGIMSLVAFFFFRRVRLFHWRK